MSGKIKTKMNNSFEEIKEKLDNSKRVAVVCHARPDGDALGSGVALCVALENAGKQAYMFCEDLPPEKFSFNPSFKRVKNVLPQTDFDMIVSVDCADMARMGIFSKRFKNFKNTTVNIDHHMTNEGYAKLNYVKECPATCEIMTEFMISAGYEVTEEIANLLMLGLITDSGNFVHQDVTENTFKIAAYLRARGADVNAINYNMFGRQTKARALLYGRTVNKMGFALGDKLAYLIISEKDMSECGADKSLTEGFVDFPLTVDGVEVAVSLLEYKDNCYKASLRSKGKVNVNEIASSFGGGGHKLASGCMLFGELEEVKEKIIFAVSKYL